MRHSSKRHSIDAIGSDPGPELSTRLEPDFGHVDPAARISMSLVRTLRVPGDGRARAIPSGLGRLPMARVRDLDRTLPTSWQRDRGIVVPVYQSEALRLLIEAPAGYPFAVKVLADGLNLVTGRAWRPGLARRPRNHLVVPGEHHLDGVRGPDGRLRQIAARPLDGVDAAAGALGDAVMTHGLQLVVTPLKVEVWRRLGPAARPARIHTDPWGTDAWDARHTQTCFVRLVQAHCWQVVTGHPVPHPPISRELYRGARVPWFEYFEADREVPNQGRSLRELDEPGRGRSA